MRGKRKIHRVAFCVGVVRVDEVAVHVGASGPGSPDHIRVSEVSMAGHKTSDTLIIIVLSSVRTFYVVYQTTKVEHSTPGVVIGTIGGHGMLYANQTSPICASAPIQSLRDSATAVLTAHPTRMTMVVNRGWQSSTTVYGVSKGRSIVERDY